MRYRSQYWYVLCRQQIRVAKTTPKVCYTDEIIDGLYPTSGLNYVLKECLRYFSQLGIEGVIQGDLLFTENTKKVTTVNGKQSVVFQPNTITYAIPLDTDLGKRVNASKIGIVFHTHYTGSSLPEMSAGFGVDVSPYQGNSEIAVFSSDFVDASGSANFTTQELQKFKSSVNQAEGSLRQASKFLDVMKGTDKFAFNTVFKTFFNTYIRKLDSFYNQIPGISLIASELLQFVHYQADNLGIRLIGLPCPDH